MIQNPFRRKRDPLDQVLDALEGVRAEAAQTAADIRDVASKAADALGEAAPEGSKKRLPLLGALVAGGAAIAIVIRARARSAAADVQPPTPAPSASPTAVATAAETTTVPPSAPGGEDEAAAADEVEVAADTSTPEEPGEPKAETDESRAAEG